MSKEANGSAFNNKSNYEMNGDPKSTVASGSDIPANPLLRLKELMDLNKLWKQEYDQLQKKYEQEKGQLQEDNNKLKQEVRRSELRCSILETKNLTLQSELVRLAKTFESLHPQHGKVSKKSSKEMEDIELIREQLDAYKEDFKLEHQDKEKIQSEKESLQEKLSRCEKFVHSLNKELDLYKKECKRLHEEKARPKLEQRHPSIDRSNSYPLTSSFSETDVPFGSVSGMARRHCLGERREGYLSLEDFRNEQYKRGILVRNPSQSRPPPGRPARVLSDSLPPDSTNKTFSSSGRTSCLW